jgi:hypothetical protein
MMSEMRKEMVDGPALEKKLVHHFTSSMRTESTLMEMKINSMKGLLETAHKSQFEKLEQRLNEVDYQRIQADAELMKDVALKFEQLQLNVAAELGQSNKCLEEYLQGNLIRMGGRMDIVESIQNRPAIGFTARTLGFTINTKSAILKAFKEIISNNGGHYNASTGVFTAPIAGMYMANLTHTQSDEGEIFLTLIHSRRGDTPLGVKSWIAYTWTYGKHSTSSDSSVIHMQEGEQVYVQVQHFCGSGQIWSPSSFSCFLVH